MSHFLPSTALWPLLLYAGIVLLIVASMIGFSYFLGQRHRDRATGATYESGVLTTGDARLRFDVSYYLIAVFFLIFDLEAVFLFAWAVAAGKLGWPGYFEALIFIGVLGAGLAYIWRLGALDWLPGGRKPSTHQPA